MLINFVFDERFEELGFCVYGFVSIRVYNFVVELMIMYLKLWKFGFVW